VDKDLRVLPDLAVDLEVLEIPDLWDLLDQLDILVDLEIRANQDRLDRSALWETSEFLDLSVSICSVGSIALKMYTNYKIKNYFKK